MLPLLRPLTLELMTYPAFHFTCLPFSKCLQQSASSCILPRKCNFFSCSQRSLFSSVLAETEPHEGKRKVESLWPIFRLHHQRSRYIFDLFYKRKAISRGIRSFHSSLLMELFGLPFIIFYFPFHFLFHHFIASHDKRVYLIYKYPQWSFIQCIKKPVMQDF